MKIITVRHGQTKCNKMKISQGWLNDERAELNKNGLDQAKKVAEKLKKEKIDIIYSSDLRRAAKTAKLISKFHDCVLILEKRLREQCKGEYEGKLEISWEELSKSGKQIENWTPKGGESLKDMKKRVMGFILEIEKKHHNKTVLIVSHGGPLAVFSRHFHDDWVFKGKVNHSHKNSSISEYTYDGKKWNINKFNCVEHLK